MTMPGEDPQRILTIAPTTHQRLASCNKSQIAAAALKQSIRVLAKENYKDANKELIQKHQIYCDKAVGDIDDDES